MAAPVLDVLLKSLLSKTGQEQITNQEITVFNKWKNQTIKSCAAVGSVAIGLTWIATRKFNIIPRVTIVGGAGLVTSLWRMGVSADSCVDRILGMDGSRMQYELNRIILEKYGNDPKEMQRFSKHFYFEEIFNDSIPGRPKLVCQSRHLYVDSHRTADGNTYQESAKKVVDHKQRNDDSSVNYRIPGAEIKQLPRNPGITIFGYGDPLDVLFGNSSTKEEPHQLDESETSAKVHSRSRRARRRHRLRHRHQESLLMGEG